MERELGKDLEQGKKRVAFLMDNCDAVEEKGYMKPFTPEELARMKESLSETDIEINDIEEEKTPAMKVQNDPQGLVITKWQLSPEELERVKETGTIHLSMLTFNQPLQPVLLTVDFPTDK